MPSFSKAYLELYPTLDEIICETVPFLNCLIEFSISSLFLKLLKYILSGQLTLRICLKLVLLYFGGQYDRL